MSATDSKHTTIRVSNLPDEVTRDQLKIHFQRKKNGGGEVTEVQMIPDTHEALVVFEEERVLETAILKEHTFQGTIIRVEKYEETKDKCAGIQDVSKENRMVLVSELPEGITESGLTIYFQRTKNAGGEVKEVQLFSDKHEALVVFEDYKVAQAVLSKEHIIQKKAVRVKPQETESQTPNEKRKVLVAGLPEGITENEVHIYFQRRKNQGGEIRNVTLSSTGRALVTFDDPKVASAVVDKVQIIKGKLLKLKIVEGEIAISSLSEEKEVPGDDQMESGHKMQTKRVSDDREKEPEKEPHEVSGREHNMHPEKWQDNSVSAEPKVTKEHVNTQQMTKGNEDNESPTTTNKENAEDFLSMRKEKDYLGKTMLVSDIPEGVSETDMLLYFQKRSNGGGEVEQAKLFPERRQALVVFAEVQVAENVVLKDHMLKGQHVRVEKYNPKPKETKVDFVFTTVTATINSYLLQTIEPTLCKAILDETQAVTGIQWHQAAYGLLITGSLEQVKKANDVLKEKFSAASSQQQNTAEHVQSWQGIVKGPDTKSREYQVDRSMMGPASKHDPERYIPQISVRNESHRNMEPSPNFMAELSNHDKERYLSQISVRNESSFSKQNSSHRNMEPNERSGNFVAEVSNQEKQWIHDQGGKADWDDNQRSGDSNVFGKQSEDSGKFTPSYGHRASFDVSPVNVRDMTKKPLETAGRQSSSSPLHSPRGSIAGNCSRNEAGTHSLQELKTPADFQQPGFANFSTEHGSVVSSPKQRPSPAARTPADFQQPGFANFSTQQGSVVSSPKQRPSPAARGRAPYQNVANADTPPPEEAQEGEAKPAKPQSHADRRPNAANFSPLPIKQPQSVQDNLLGSKATVGTTNLMGGTEFENLQDNQSEIAAFDDKGSSHDSLQHESDGAHQLKSDDSENGDLATDAHDSEEPSVDYERNQDASLDIIENAFQQMKLDEEPSINVAQFIQKVYQEDLETFKSQFGVDVVLSQDQKRFTLKPMRGVKQSKINEAERKFQQFYESTRGKLKAFTIDLRKFTTEDSEKIKKSMLRQRGQFDVMMEESNRDVYTLVGDAENVDMFRRNVIGALRKNSPISKETAAPTEPMVASRKGIRVILMLGEIEKQECDAIVNFTDTALVHKTGLANAIREAAGMTFWKECRDIIAKNGALMSNMVTITTAGSLPCKYVMHAILPELSNERRQEVLRHGLQETCRSALSKAKEKQMKSICFPVVTSDISNLPAPVSSRLLFKVILEFIEENSPLNNNTIEEIRIIYRKSSKFAEEYIKEFSKTLQCSGEL